MERSHIESNTSLGDCYDLAYERALKRGSHHMPRGGHMPPKSKVWTAKGGVGTHGGGVKNNPQLKPGMNMSNFQA